MDEWVWSNGGMILTGENWSTGRKTLYSVGGRWMSEYGAMVEWYWQGKRKIQGEKSVTVPLCLQQIPIITNYKNSIICKDYFKMIRRLQMAGGEKKQKSSTALKTMKKAGKSQRFRAVQLPVQIAGVTYVTRSTTASEGLHNVAAWYGSRNHIKSTVPGIEYDSCTSSDVTFCVCLGVVRRRSRR